MIEITAASKKNFGDEKSVRQGIAKFYPGWQVESVVDKGDEWWVRLSDGPPPFLKKKDDSDSDSSDAPKDESPDSDKSEAESDDSDDSTSDESEEGESKDDGGGDALGKLKSLVEQITSLFDELSNKAGEIADDAQAKDDKIKEIGDSVKEHLAPTEETPPLPPDSTMSGPPAPGGPPMGSPPVPRGPRPAQGLDKRRRMPGGGGVSTFTKRRTEIVTHPGVNDKGERISLVAAAAELEQDPEWAEYAVDGMTANTDGTYSVKLKLR